MIQPPIFRVRIILLLKSIHAGKLVQEIAKAIGGSNIGRQHFDQG